MPTELEVAWAAGFFEGEGCVTRYSRGGKRAHEYVYSVQLNNTDKDVIDKFARIMGCGSMDRMERANRKVIWLWRVRKRLDMVRVLKMLRPHMGERRGIAFDLALLEMGVRSHLVPDGVNA